jgi:hypothetical protein
MALLPDDRIGVMVMTNSWGAASLRGAIASRIFDTLLGIKETRDWSAEELAAYRRGVARAAEELAAVEKARIPNAKPSRPLDAYAGAYTDPLYGDMNVKLENGALTLQFARGEIADLTPWQYDTFRVTWRDRAYEDFDTFAAFGLDPRGTPRRLDMQLFRDAIEAKRSAAVPAAGQAASSPPPGSAGETPAGQPARTPARPAEK